MHIYINTSTQAILAKPFWGGFLSGGEGGIWSLPATPKLSYYQPVDNLKGFLATRHWRLSPYRVQIHLDFTK